MLPHQPVRRTLVATVLTAMIATLGITASSPSTADAPNPVTPGLFTGLGFDQCEAPSQKAMTAWLKSSPFRAAGIYISGSLRYCQKQTNLTPTWVRTQLTTGWRLLPIHLGAQASCTTRDRYQVKKISAVKANNYAQAQGQGRVEADEAVAAATRLGIVPRSTIYYDLEAFSIAKAACRNSALWFLHAWTTRLHELGYVSGVYSSAASGMKILDDARVTPGNPIALPDQIWIADWNGKANDQSSYIRSDGWIGRRLHQFQGGHNETWGGVTINIDRNYLKLTVDPSGVLGPVVDPCASGTISRPAYRVASATKRPKLTPVLQCLLKQRGLYNGKINGKWNKKTTKALKAFQRKVRHRVQAKATRGDWTALLAAGGKRTVLRPGIQHSDVVRVQRALNAAAAPRLQVTGVYDAPTQAAVAAYQRKVLRIKPTRVVAVKTWKALKHGRR